MTAAGWILMSLSVGTILCLTGYCFYRVLTTGVTKGRLHAPLDIETDEEP